MARSIFGGIGGPKIDPQRIDGAASRVQKVAQLEHHRDTFEQLPQKANALRTMQAERSFYRALQATAGLADGFEGAKRRPLDLSGGLAAPKPQLMQSESKAAVVASNGFSASLDDFS